MHIHNSIPHLNDLLRKLLILVEIVLHVDISNYNFVAQRAVDSVLASGAKPHHSEGGQDTSMNTSMQADEGEENVENSLAAQTEMLKTVTQLLQQTSQV